MPRRLRRLAAALVVLGALAPLGPRAHSEIRAASTGLYVEATMPTGSPQIVRMLVDHELDLGFGMGPVTEGGVTTTMLFTYDLEALRIVDSSKVPYFGLSPDLAFLDTANHRILFPPGNRGAESAGCPAGPAQSMALAVYTIATKTWSTIPVPCSAGDQLKTQGVSFHAPSGKLYSIGARQGEWSARALGGVTDRYGQALLLRQVDAKTGALDWEIDLRAAGCDAFINGTFGGFAQRDGDHVVSYCYGPRNSLEGSQGFALRVPLVAGRPQQVDGQPVIVSAPTLPNDLAPVLDPGSGRLLLLTAGAANGNAVWVFNPAKDRFFGVIASGSSGAPGSAIYAGLDPVRGRAYLMTDGDVLVADARHNPLPAGLSYRVLEGAKTFTSGPYLAVSSKQRRIFVPTKDRGFVVLRDAVPDAVSPPAPDPDRGTADVAEEPGKTGAVHSGVATAFGAHVLNTGGIPRAVDNADPLCYSLLSAAVKDARGRCLADQVLTSGNREVFLASTVVEATSETGAAAVAVGGAVATKDTATDADFRRLGGCMQDVATERGAPSPPTAFVTLCAGSPLAAAKSGARGGDGRGYPIPAATCESFSGTSPTSDTRAPSLLGLPGGTIASGKVSCDGSKRAADAVASSSALALPDVANPTFAVARTTSASKTELTAAGVVTTVSSGAYGVHIAGVTIGRIETAVTTKAHGRTGTTSVSFKRTFADVTGPNLACVSCKPEQVVAAINTAVGQRARASLPEGQTTASPRGFQAVAVKDPELRDSDRALNDDDTFTVAGLQVVIYNDGRFGRSRAVVQLAGVQSESRYGIFVNPEVGEGTVGDALTGEVSSELSAADVDVSVIGFGPDPLAPVAASSGSALGDALGTVGDVASAAALMPPRLVAKGISLVVHNPRELALLAGLWSMLAAPLYLGLRRRWLLEELDDA